jgi:hypothetical protein
LRQEHRGGGRHREDHLGEAANGYLDLLEIARRAAAAGADVE